MKTPKLKIEQRETTALVPYVRNAKDHPRKQIRVLARFIRRVGFRFPIHVDEKGEIIAGHGRLLAAQFVGLTTVPVIVHGDLTEEEKRELRLADNRIAELAETNKGNLLFELHALEEAGEALESFGYDDDVLDELEGAAKDVDRSGAEPKVSGLTYKIMIECDDEQHQLDSLAALEEEGYRCQPLIV